MTPFLVSFMLVVLLHQEGWQVSTAMVERVLTSLKVRGVVQEPLRTGVSVRKRLWRRSYAIRKPKGYWEHTYNTIRPHQALGYLTPLQFVTQWQHQR